jgi:hypothetical protein
MSPSSAPSAPRVRKLQTCISPVAVARSFDVHRSTWHALPDNATIDPRVGRYDIDVILDGSPRGVEPLAPTDRGGYQLHGSTNRVVAIQLEVRARYPFSTGFPAFFQPAIPAGMMKTFV